MFSVTDGSDQLITDSDAENKLSPLKYIDVCLSIEGRDADGLSMTALCDSGAEICCVIANLVDYLNPVTVGRVNLRPFCGESIDDVVACFSISCDDHCINVYAAIVPNLHDEMILTADAVDSFFYDA